MEKPIQYKDGVDYEKTLGALAVGDYVIVPSSSQDISAIRTAVCKAAKKISDANFVVNKTVNGARIQRSA
jgi:hypothetical protein